MYLAGNKIDSPRYCDNIKLHYQLHQSELNHISSLQFMYLHLKVYLMQYLKQL